MMLKFFGLVALKVGQFGIETVFVGAVFSRDGIISKQAQLKTILLNGKITLPRL